MTTALLFQGGMIVVVIALAFLFGLRPWLELRFSWSALGLSVLATLPLAAGLLMLPSGRWRWMDELTALVRRFVRLLFRNARPGAVVAVSVLAGISEEFLFRGVVQGGLSELWTPALGLISASLLFGAAHALTPGYLVLATIMGLYLGLLYYLSGNLLVPIIVHALYDWIAIRYYLRDN